MKSKLIIIGGPSGGGKTTICNFIPTNFPNIRYYKNQLTTRKPRPNEGKKGAYQSIPLVKFHQLGKNNQLLMKTKFAGNYYGYTNDFISDIKKYFKQKQSLIIDSIQPIDNWMQFKNKFPEISVTTIFVYSKDMMLLKSRIMKRSTSSPKDTAKRLAHAKKVISIESKKYDFKIDTTNPTKGNNKILLIMKRII
jgi:guanylate kinase